MNDVHCELPACNPPSQEIKEILSRYRTIAVVGLSPKEERDSNQVARYLMEQGYTIVPVNPGQKEILGKACFKTLKDIPFQVDVVDLFLNPARVPAAVDEAVEIGAKVVWMQLGIIHKEAAERAVEAGLRVVMNHCMKQEHEKLMSLGPL